jgi:hypothetical protein
VRQVILLCTLTMAVSVFFWPVAVSEASPVVASGGWSPPVAISGLDRRAGGWFPAIAADIYGQVHVVWNGRAPQRAPATSVEAGQRVSDAAGWLIYAHSDGQRWSAPSEIAAIGDEGDALRSSLTTDQTGRLHMLYRGLDLRDPKVGGAENEPIRYASVDSLLADRSQSWMPGPTVSRRNPAYFSDIVTDSAGTLHALTTEADGDKQYAVYYHRSEDGGRTWSVPVAIEQVLAVSRWRLQLKVGPNDDLHAVWECVDPDDPSSRVPVGFVYARSTDHGQTWSTTIFSPPKQAYIYPKLFEGTRWRVQPAVGVDGRGQIVVVWREYETNLLYFQRSTDGRTWTDPARVGGVARGVARPFDRYDMATDSAGRLHLVMVAYPDGSPTMALLHSEWLGYGWGQPEVILYAATAPYPEWPRLVVGAGNVLHLAWFGGSADSVDRVPIGIWYSSKLTSAPRLPVAAIPTRTVPQLATTPAVALPTPTVRTAPSTTTGNEVSANPDADHQAFVAGADLQPALWPIGLGIVGSVGVLILFLIVRRPGFRR